MEGYGFNPPPQVQICMQGLDITGTSAHPLNFERQRGVETYRKTYVIVLPTPVRAVRLVAIQPVLILGYCYHMNQR